MTTLAELLFDGVEEEDRIVNIGTFVKTLEVVPSDDLTPFVESLLAEESLEPVEGEPTVVAAPVC